VTVGAKLGLPDGDGLFIKDGRCEGAMLGDAEGLELSVTVGSPLGARDGLSLC